MNLLGRALLFVILSGWPPVLVLAAPLKPPSIRISPTPLILVRPTHPQVLLAVANSQSMDGDLSGAIMTGSGTFTAFNKSSSPVNYTVPAGFTPPVQGASGGVAPYTVKVNGTLYDNSASRLNVAKAALKAVIKQYAANFDFGLMDYSTGTPGLYTTWVYYMSDSGGFTFGNPGDLPPSGTHWVANPCYQSSAGYCKSIKKQLGSQTLQAPLLAIAASSDDADINDVLYSNSLPDIFMVYGGPSPASPYPPHFNLSDYNKGNILLIYSNTAPNIGSFGLGPTNAGYVPYSLQSIDARRGFGYYTSASATKGHLLVKIKPAGTAGKPATPSQIKAYIKKFAPYLAPETNKPKSKEIKALAVQSPIGGILHGARNYFQKSDPPGSNSCPAKRYVVLVTDGLPTEDLSGSSWPPLGSISGNKYKVTATFNLKTGGTIKNTDPGFAAAVANGNTAGLVATATNDQALIDAIDQLQALAKAGIKTYIVGMGAGVDPSKNPAAAATLKAMAIAGGTGHYFPGTSPQAVVNDMQVIFAQIQAANRSATSAAVSAGKIQSNTLVYQAQFSTQPEWSGNVVAYPIQIKTGVITVSTTPEWKMANKLGQQLSSPGWRTFPSATWNPKKGKGVPFTWARLDPAQQKDLTSHWKKNWSLTKTLYGKEVVNFIQGRNDLKKHFRSRSVLLGDIVDSTPVVVGAPFFVSGLSAPSGSSTQTRAAYLAASKAYDSFYTKEVSRQPMLYVGANDGHLYGVNANNGTPMFSFVPNGIYHDLAHLTQRDYNKRHRFYVDGPVVVAPLPFSTAGVIQWHTVLAGGLQDGGKGIYALDVTHPGSMTTSSEVATHVLWDITNATQGFSHLGLTYSQPQLAVMNIKKANSPPVPTSVAIFGNGYNSKGGMPYLYIVNAQTGVLIKSFNLCTPKTGIEPAACKTSGPNGLSTPVALSTQGDGIINRVYAGDLQGNLWRFDLSSPDPAHWMARVLFKAIGSKGTDQPITDQPDASFAPFGVKGIMVFFGTGRMLSVGDLTNTRTQSFYGILDRDSNPNSWLTQADLQQQIIQQTTYQGTGPGNVSVTRTVRTINTIPVNYANVDGWFMDLPISGERVTTHPSVFSQEVIFTTNTPPANACNGGFQSFLMVVNFANGGAFGVPMLDLNHDGQINSTDQAHGKNPIGVSMGGVFSPAPTVAVTPNGHSVIMISNSNGKIPIIQNKAGLKRGIINWVELR